jgi:catechol 2,3-dioxygenase-like lactoylglutathione lyase family enzyme
MSSRRVGLSPSSMAAVDDQSLTEIVFEVDDVVASHSEMSAKGVPFEVEPRTVTSDGARDLLATHFRDPDGHVASITAWVETG